MAKTVTIKGTNGSFTVEIDGGHISIKYRPDKTKVKCKKIVFIQRLSRTVDGKPVKPASLLKNHPDLATGHSDDQQLDDGSHIDHLFCEKDPYYNGDDSQDAGQKGNTDKDGSDSESQMTDNPYFPDSDLPNADSVGEKKFEICAYCIETKTFLDCITWTYTRKKGDPGRGSITVDTKASSCSVSMKDALSKFIEKHGEGDKAVCPEKKRAEEKDAKKPGGEKTIRIRGGTDIRVWDFGVDPDAVRRSVTLLESVDAELSSAIAALAQDITAVRGGSADRLPELVEKLEKDLDRAGIAGGHIRALTGELRGEGFGMKQASRPIETTPIQLVMGDDIADYRTHQIRITFLSGQDKTPPTLVLHSFLAPVDFGSFVFAVRPAIDYQGDGAPSWSLSVKPEDLRRLVIRIGDDDALSNSQSVPPEPHFSLMIAKRQGDKTVVFESLVDEESAGRLVSFVLESLDPANVFAVEMATSWSRIVTPP